MTYVEAVATEMAKRLWGALGFLSVAVGASALALFRGQRWWLAAGLALLVSLCLAQYAVWAKAQRRADDLDQKLADLSVAPVDDAHFKQLKGILKRLRTDVDGFLPANYKSDHERLAVLSHFPTLGQLFVEWGVALGEWAQAGHEFDAFVKEAGAAAKVDQLPWSGDIVSLVSNLARRRAFGDYEGAPDSIPTEVRTDDVVLWWHGGGVGTPILDLRTQSPSVGELLDQLRALMSKVQQSDQLATVSTTDRERHRRQFGLQQALDELAPRPTFNGTCKLCQPH